ncbi:MAG: HD domain-containing protein [Saprospiraceae bacterium]
MNKKKIINDPVYGFITIPHELIFEIIEHRYFQRLRRIKQLGLTEMVYPGAIHTRLNHALGALHLMGQAIETLRNKGIEISAEEELGANVAILLHDIGHGPLSHALENKILPIHHETLSLMFMEAMNAELGGRLSIGIEIFCDTYPKKFLHQLVSGQLDMDRMDYLNRDSFFTGVSEGVIGYDRIIKMLNIVDNELVIEEKGIYSIEKFLIARRIMYWQVYLHKTVVSAEQMIIKLIDRYKKNYSGQGGDVEIHSFEHFLLAQHPLDDFLEPKNDLLDHFSEFDDCNLISLIKKLSKHEDFVLSFLAKGIINRQLLKVEFHANAPSGEKIKEYQQKAMKTYNISATEADFLVFTGTESNRTYSKQKDEIKVLFKSGEVRPFSTLSEYYISSEDITKHYFCYPRWLS